MKDLKLTENEFNAVSKIVDRAMHRTNESGNWHWDLTIIKKKGKK